MDGPSDLIEKAHMNVRDGTLVIGALNGDRAAFAELYDRRARLIRAVCYDQTGDTHSAAELTQEVFLRAYRDLRLLHAPDKFPIWLIGIARQVCREWRRKRGRERRAMAEFADRRALADQWADPPDARLMELREAIAGTAAHGLCRRSLTEQERLALHAFYLQDRDVEDARGVLGLSRSGFYRVLSSACERLRMMLDGKRVRHAGCKTDGDAGSNEVRS
jgi:RNA polymerase sigma-70 factor, ECF subfamily